MRMRRKKNLEKRLDNCEYNLINVGEIPKNAQLAVQEKHYLDYQALFGNSNPVELEIGCGKGKFIIETAIENPDINYIAIEKYDNVIVQACEKAEQEKITNLKFMNIGAEYLERYLKSGSIRKIYLNFSCPYPKKSYANRRLTNKRFLKIYEALLSSEGEIYQKTDNQGLFEYSIEQFSQYGYCLKNVSLDLHKSDFLGNVETEYEHKFSSLGKPIYRLEAYLR